GVSWIGARATPISAGVTGYSAKAKTDGGFNGLSGTHVEGGYVYVADTGNARVMKYDATTGAFIGWIGSVATSPLGGESGCAGAAPNTPTPGWCLGGTSKFSTLSTG